MELKPHASGRGTLEEAARGWTLRIPEGAADGYRLAQLDDYMGLRRSEYRWKPPVRLSLQARVTMQNPAGTWGFGFWNDPYGFAVGTGSQFLRLPALPEAAWFFAASQRNYLAFRDDLPANGFMAQAFRSPRFDRRLIPAAAAFPFSPKTTRQMLSRIIIEDAMSVVADARVWRTYSVEWGAERTAFRVDGQLVLESNVSPRGPLGIVIWIDNQYAAFDTQGKVRWGVEATAHECSLEVAEIEVAPV